MADGQIKIGDFGCGKEGEATDATKTIRGTPVYLSPAKMLAKRGTTGRVKEDTEKGDVWSLGLTILYMCTFEKPKDYTSKSIGQTKLRDYLKTKTQRYSDLIRYALWWMLQVEEKKRWTFQQVLDSLNKIENVDFTAKLSDPQLITEKALESRELELIKSP
jgi:serine/threonine protein kinase